MREKQKTQEENKEMEEEVERRLRKKEKIKRLRSQREGESLEIQVLEDLDPIHLHEGGASGCMSAAVCTGAARFAESKSECATRSARKCPRSARISRSVRAKREEQ